MAAGQDQGSLKIIRIISQERLGESRGRFNSHAPSKWGAERKQVG